MTANEFGNWLKEREYILILDATKWIIKSEENGANLIEISNLSSNSLFCKMLVHGVDKIELLEKAIEFAKTPHYERWSKK